MTRIRTLTAAGVVVGATVLGGAGLAAADMHEADDTTSTDVEEVVEVDENGDPIAPEDLDTGEADEAEETELDEDAATEETETTETTEADDSETAEVTAEGNHGQYVSGVAQSTEPGPGHGAAVSAAAHEQRDAKQAEAGTAPEEAETEDADDAETDDVEEVETDEAEETEVEDDAEVEDDSDDSEDAEEQEQGPAPQAAGKGR